MTSNNINNNRYWKSQDQQQVEAYLTATTQREREKAITALLPAFKLIADTVQFRFSGKINEELTQDLVTTLASYSLPRIKADKKQAAFQYFWLLAEKRLITANNSKYQQIKVGLDDQVNKQQILDNYYGSCENHYENQEQQQLYKQQIICRLNDLIDKQKLANDNNYVYLNLLKDYYLQGKDLGEFKRWCCEVMGIRTQTFHQINKNLGIATRLFSEARPILDEQQITIRKQQKRLARQLKVDKQPLPYSSSLHSEKKSQIF